MATTTVRAVQRPTQEIFDDAQAVVESARISDRPIVVGAKGIGERLHLAAIKDITCR